MDQEQPLLAGSGAAGSGDVVGHKADWKRKLIRAARQFLWMFLYLYVVFGLFLLHESVVLARYDIPFTRWGFALVTAFVLAKVMLVMEDFNIARGFESRPLIYSIAYKCVVYAAVFLVAYIAEEAALGMLHGNAFLESIPSIGGGTPQGIVLTGLIVSLALVPYVAFKGIDRELGEGRLNAVLFTRGRNAGAAYQAAKPAR